MDIESELGQPTDGHCHVGTKELDPEVNSGGFHKVVQLKAKRGLTDYEKFYLLNHHFVPSST